MTDGEYWSKYLHNVGNVPFYILAGDADRFFRAIYASELLRLNPEWKDTGISELGYGRKSEWDPTAPQPETEGVRWGGPDPKEKTVRSQVERAEAKKIQDNREFAAPADPALELEASTDAYLSKWWKAEKLASGPRSKWENAAVDWEMGQMVRWCYGWLRETGEVPQPYPMTAADLFWPRPMPSEVAMEAEVVKRRNFVTNKVMKFWRKTIKAEESYDRMRFSPLSYRVTLAAQLLTKYIEMYAVNYQTDPDLERDEEIIKKCGKAAKKYYLAHFPITDEGAKPGPLGTLDPTYVEYIRLCRKYSLEIGDLLHEQEL